MIAQVQGEHVITLRQVPPRRLPVARGAEDPVEDDERGPAGAAEVAVEQMHAEK